MFSVTKSATVLVSRVFIVKDFLFSQAKMAILTHSSYDINHI